MSTPDKISNLGSSVPFGHLIQVDEKGNIVSWPTIQAMLAELIKQKAEIDSLRPQAGTYKDKILMAHHHQYPSNHQVLCVEPGTVETRRKQGWLPLPEYTVPQLVSLVDAIDRDRTYLRGILREVHSTIELEACDKR